ncbi:Uncharacterised protein [Streptococcus pneumoniae]|nr:Uncharacterised protein [Streptococcus pneumoniae]COG34241.1 Uncharacterised protein [Streptococcus pneumoniae]COR82549.1 Uncharacterised protein [Streptococcus pneumoniae]CRG02970.1 Uncharacterised protein [Streptococcus pneumoniae]
MQRILYAASSSPKHFINIVVAAFDAAYAAISILGVFAAFEPTVTIAPDFLNIIFLLTARDILKTPVVFTENVLVQSSSLNE